MKTLLQALGITLLLGAVGHTIGVARFYLVTGVPDANRVLLDLWIAEAQLLAGGLYLAAARNARNRVAWRALAAFGAFTAIGFTAAILPVLFFRAPMLFRIPPISYLLLSVVVLARLRASQDTL